MKTKLCCFVLLLLMIPITAFGASAEIKGAEFSAQSFQTSLHNGTVNFNTSIPTVWCVNTFSQPVSGFVPEKENSGDYVNYLPNPITVTGGGGSPSLFSRVAKGDYTGQYIFNGNIGNAAQKTGSLVEYYSDFNFTEDASNMGSYLEGGTGETREEKLTPTWGFGGYDKYSYQPYGHVSQILYNPVRARSADNSISILPYDFSSQPTPGASNYSCDLCGRDISGSNGQTTVPSSRHFVYIDYQYDTVYMPNNIIVSDFSYVNRNSNWFIDLAKQYIKDTTAHQVSRTYYQFQSSGINSGTITSSISNGTNFNNKLFGI